MNHRGRPWALAASTSLLLVAVVTRHGFAQPAPAPPATPPPDSPHQDAGAASADDLAKAADATAEAAAIGAPGPGDLAKAADAAAEIATVTSAPPAGKPSSDDIDLSSLGLEPTGAGFDDKLNIYGFADVSYYAQHFVQPLPTIAQDTRTFEIGNLNLYLAKNLTPRARSLAEVRFTFLPNGSKNADGSYVDTTAQDLSAFLRPIQWGGIVIERVYAEYDLTEHLTIRAGHWLSPYGIWNMDHGSPTIVGTSRPYIIGEQFIPEHQTGLDLFGDHYLGAFKLDYHVTASNGRGTTEPTYDQDSKFAFGGSVKVETPWGLKAGASYYRGRYTGLPAAPGALAETYREASYGADAQYNHGALHLQSEAMMREHHYVAGQRPANAAGFAPDALDTGLYFLGAWRFDQLWNVTPYTLFESYQTSTSPYFGGLKSLNIGLNFRPSPNLVFKLQGDRTRFDDGPEPLANQKVYSFSAQASWVF